MLESSGGGLLIANMPPECGRCCRAEIDDILILVIEIKCFSKLNFIINFEFKFLFIVLSDTAAENICQHNISHISIAAFYICFEFLQSRQKTGNLSEHRMLISTIFPS